MDSNNRSKETMRLIRAAGILAMFPIAAGGFTSGPAAARELCLTFLDCATASACLAPVGNQCTSCPDGQVVCGDHDDCGGNFPYAVYCAS